MARTLAVQDRRRTLVRAEIGHRFLTRMHMVLFGGKRHGASEMSLRSGATVCFTQSCHRWDSQPEYSLSLAWPTVQNA